MRRFPHRHSAWIIPATLLLAGIALCTAARAQPFPGRIGVNVDAIGGSALELEDAALTARPWQSIATGSDAAADAHGWPTEDFRALFFDRRPFNAWNNASDDPTRYLVDLSGTYTLSFSGQATLTSWSDAPIAFQQQRHAPAANRTTVEIVFPPGGDANKQIGTTAS